MEVNSNLFFYKITMNKLLFFFFLFLLFCGCGINKPTDNSFAKSVRILYFNDAHELNSVQTEIGLIGGVTRMKTLIDSLKKETPDALVLFGGDLAGGTLGGKLFRGSVMVEALNTFPVDYANFGQHEFDYGINNTQMLIRTSHFKWFTSNVLRTNGTPIPESYPYILHSINRKKIGILGLTDKINTSKPTSGVKQTDIMQAAKTTIRQMGKVDYLIAVTQMDMNLNEALLKECPEINLILTEETSQYKTEVQFVNNCPIIAGCGNMGQLVDVCTDNFGNSHVAVHTVDSLLHEDQALRAFSNAKTEIATKQLNETLTMAPSEFKNQTNQNGSDFTGCVVTDAFRLHYGVQAAIINGGGIRTLIPSGKVTVKDVYAVFPFENIVIPVRLTGKEIKEIIRLAAERMLPQVSGLTYVMKTGKKPEIGEVHIAGKPLDDTQMYTVALPDYIVLGGGNFSAIAPSRWIKSLESCTVDAEVLKNYLKTHPDFSALNCNRITVIESK